MQHRTAWATLALIGSLALVALNIAALTLGWGEPVLVAVTISVDLCTVGVAFWFAWRQALLAEATMVERTTAQRQETARMQAALEDSEARYSAILDSAMDAVITVDASQTILVFNQAAEHVFGCARSEAIGGPLARFIPQRFRETHAGHVQRFAQTGITNRRMGDATVLMALHANGREFPIEASISQTNTDGRPLFTVILRDITRRKLDEDALRRSQQELRDLSAQVLQAREDEKTHIARELHDELGQSLTALKMDLAWLRQHLTAEHSALSARAARMNETLHATVLATRRIAGNLRPLMLDDLGLADAAEWLVEDFSQRSEITCDVEIADHDQLGEVSSVVATALYRILQESLTNVSRHANARHLYIRLQRHGALVQLCVEDDGRGILPEDRAKPTSFGLRGMQERARFLGGTLEITAGPAGGTRLLATLPAQTERDTP